MAKHGGRLLGDNDSLSPILPGSSSRSGKRVWLIALFGALHVPRTGQANKRTGVKNLDEPPGVSPESTTAVIDMNLDEQCEYYQRKLDYPLHLAVLTIDDFFILRGSFSCPR